MPRDCELMPKSLLTILLITLFTVNASGAENNSDAATQKPVATIDFEPTEDGFYTLRSGAKLTDASKAVISGKGSLLWDGVGATRKWNEFFHSNSNKIPLKAKGTYTISLKYKILEKSTDKSALYFLIRSNTAGVKADKGWTEIKTETGASGKQVKTFTLGDFPDYYLDIGFRSRGKVVIDEIRIFEGKALPEKEVKLLNVPEEKRYIIDRAQNIAIDGDGKDFGTVDNLHKWHAPKYLNLDSGGFFSDKKKWKGPQDLSGRVVLQKDDSYLYVFAELIDDDPMNQTEGSRWEKDYVELFLSMKPHLSEPDQYLPGDYQIQLLPGNEKITPSIYALKTTTVGKKSEHTVTDSKIIAKKQMVELYSESGMGYTLEAKISLKNFPELTTESQHMVFNVAVGDRDGATYKKCFVAGTDKSYMNMNDFLCGFIYEYTPLYAYEDFDVGAGGENCLIPDKMLPENMKGQEVRIWDMSLAATKKDDVRESICLDGIWAEQTFSSKPEALDNNGWKYLLIPTGSRDFRSRWLHPYYRKNNGKLYCITGNASNKLFRKQFYRALNRTFSLPASWKNQNVFLAIEDRGILVSLKVYVNKSLVSDKNEDGLRHIDISQHLQWDKPNTITIIANSTAIKKGDESPLSLGDVWLHKGTKEGFISSVFVKTFVPENRIEFDLALADGFSKDSTLDITLYDEETGEVATEILGNKINNYLSNNKISIETDWDSYKPWSPEHPNLYTAHFKLKNADGAVIDDCKERFGMRTSRVEGKHITLNGKPVHIRGLHLWGWGRQTYHFFKTLKEKGCNTYFHFGGNVPEYMLNWFDELGIFLIPHAGGAHVGHAFGLVDKSIQRKRWIEKVRNHPCILMYLGNITTSGRESGWTHWNFNKVGTHYAPMKSAINRAAWEGNKKTAEFLHSADPTRPVSHYCAGSQDAVWAIMNHADFGMPIQECAGGARSWANTENPKPFIMAESWPMPTGINIDMHRGEKKLPPWKQFGNRRSADNCLIIEELAQYTGDEAYSAAEPIRTSAIGNVHTATMSQMWEREKKDIWTESGNWMFRHKNPAKIALTAIALREHARSDRGYGLTGRNYFTDVFPFSQFTNNESWSKKQRNTIDCYYKPLNGLKDTLKRRAWHFCNRINLFALSPETTGIEELKELTLPRTKYHDYYLDAYSPFLMYIGGGPTPDKFRYKGHNYFTGETITKHLVICNDMEDDLTCNISWGLRTNGKVIFEKKIKVNAPSCKPVKHAISFAAPACKERSEYEIFVTTKVNGKAHSDAFGITIFPRIKMRNKNTVCLFDKHGDTQKICDSIGLKTADFKSLDSLNNNDLLIVGRNSLSSFLAEHSLSRFKEKIKSGLKVIVMEQNKGSLWLPLQKEIRVRYQFIKDSAHPILNGFKDKDFSHWRGEASLTEAYSKWDPAGEYSSILVEQMFGKWGAEGIVSTLPLVRPQHGNVRTLLSGGFDNEWAALMEYDCGNGTMIVSQLDICGRSADDPAALTIFRNMTQYMNDKRQNNYEPLASSDNAKLNELIKRFKPSVTKNLSDTQVLLVSGNSDNASQKKKWLNTQVRKNGKTMLVLLSESSADIGWLSPDITITKAKERKDIYYKHIITEEEKSIPFLRGIGSDDLYFKFRREEIPLITQVPENGKIFFGGLGASLPAGKGKVIILQLNPEQHKVERSYKKVTRIIARLLTNLGVRINYNLNLRNNGMEMSARIWKFCTDPKNKGIKERWFTEDYDDNAWRDIKVGKSWESQGVTDVNTMANTAYGTSYNGVGWYRIKFDAPQDMTTKQMFLEIAAVAGEDTVYINGKEVGKTTAKAIGGSRNITKAFRNYAIPDGLLRANGNILAIRVYNDKGVGGLSKLPIRMTTHDCPNETALYPIEKCKKFGDPYRFIMW